jgi:ABC-type enterobactin transport system permease subunit
MIITIPFTSVEATLHHCNAIKIAPAIRMEAAMAAGVAHMTAALTILVLNSRSGLAHGSRRELSALGIGIRVYLLSAWCALRCRDLMWQAGRFAMPTNAMDKGSADPWDDSHPVVVTIVVLTIISALLITAAWLMLIGHGGRALFKWIVG